MKYFNKNIIFWKYLIGQVASMEKETEIISHQ